MKLHLSINNNITTTFMKAVMAVITWKDDSHQTIEEVTIATKV